MNKTDIKNIEKCIKAREAQVFHLERGGDMTYEDIDSYSTEELKELIKQFNEFEKEKFFEVFKRKVDNFFNKYTDVDENQNVIVIAACGCEGRYMFDIDQSDIFSVIDFANHKYNKKIYAVGSEDNAYFIEKDFVDDIRNLYDDLVFGKYIQPIDKYFEDDDSVNEVWSGCYGITKDYEIISFVIRKDGMLMNDEVKTIYKF
ncbi:MAG: hypothetical protein J1F35_08340 [Erysipelotrichales bacterium]|nr:hypothetical protein [Erysipelotrichales bacterium]